MTDAPLALLFVCTGNSARSILAEALANADGAGRLRAFSAGSHPAGAVHPLALDLLAAEGLPVAGLASKPWDSFAGPGAPRLDAVVTVCDAAAGEACPFFPGAPVQAHWGLPDPAAATGDAAARQAAFAAAFRVLRGRIAALLARPAADLAPDALARTLREIGAEGLAGSQA